MASNLIKKVARKGQARSKEISLTVANIIDCYQEDNVTELKKVFRNYLYAHYKVFRNSDPVNLALEAQYTIEDFESIADKCFHSMDIDNAVEKTAQEDENNKPSGPIRDFYLEAIKHSYHKYGENLN